MNSRRKFLSGFGAVGAVGAISAMGIIGPGNMAFADDKSGKSKGTKSKSTDDEKLDFELVGRFVGKSHGDFDAVREMLKQQPALVYASWDWSGGDFETGLNAASHVGRRDIAELLLENGARLDVCAAVMLGMKSVVAEMMKLYPQLHAVPGAHEIPLLSHAIFGREKADDVFELLLDAGADVNAKSKMSMTPLMAAASVGRVSQVEVLLKKGADPTIKDTKGRSALDMARKREKFKAAKVIERALKN